MRMYRTVFELIRKNASRERYIDDVIVLVGGRNRSKSQLVSGDCERSLETSSVVTQVKDEKLGRVK